MKISVVIPNYNGEKLLRKNLPEVLRIGADEVIIIDDASSDESVAEIKKLKFKVQNYKSKLKIIEHGGNLGFARSVNDGVVAAQGDVVVLLNTDVTPKDGLLDAVLPHFKNPDVFAVSFNEGKYGWAREVFHHGLIEHRPGGEHRGETSKELRHSFWASGGSAAFSKKKWEALGGLDEIYAPFYWEDIDISYRAQMRGWKILWEPKARVLHEHEGTIGRFFTFRKKTWISERNQFIFFWKNISSLKMWLSHVTWLPLRLVRPGRLIPFLWALTKLPLVVTRRIRDHGLRKVIDEEILEKFEV